MALSKSRMETKTASGFFNTSSCAHTSECNFLLTFELTLQSNPWSWSAASHSQTKLLQNRTVHHTGIPHRTQLSQMQDSIHLCKKCTSASSRVVAWLCQHGQQIDDKGVFGVQMETNFLVEFLDQQNATVHQHNKKWHCHASHHPQQPCQCMFWGAWKRNVWFWLILSATPSHTADLADPPNVGTQHSKIDLQFSRDTLFCMLDALNGQQSTEKTQVLMHWCCLFLIC